ncbi:MAG: putative glycoside hydrolase [Solirubrobacteraceae bacterium]|nr:putative glycoside hydrolase [Patulibacter sp.]
MHVPSPEAVRAQSTVRGRRNVSLALLVSTAAALGFAPQAAQAAPKILPKTKIVAPKANVAVRGTLTGSKKCAVSFPATTKSVQITVTGPLSAKKPKTHKLKVKGTRKATCTWKTTSFTDGKYRFTAKAKVKAGGSWYTVSIKRAVNVRNRSVTAASSTEGPQYGVGNTRYVGRLETPWDSYLSQGPSVVGAFLRQHMWEVIGQSTFFDDKISWAPPALAYKDLYAIYTGDTTTAQAHPDWILKDTAGKPVFINWGCNPGPCPQYAGDFGNPSFRAAWIASAKQLIAKGYHGLWIDDANVEPRVSNAAAVDEMPVDPRTGQTMTFANWRKYIAEFLEEIRAAMPKSEIVANALWFGGTSVGRDADPYIQRAYTAVDRLNLERGFNDGGLTGGSAPRAPFSVDAFMKFIDRMHSRGVPVTLDSSAGNNPAAWEYNLAGYFLVDSGKDAVGELGLPAGTWWKGWDTKLGAASGKRTRGADGVFRRTFKNGLALLNPPNSKTVTVSLGKTYARINGSKVTSVKLAAGTGAVLHTP